MNILLIDDHRVVRAGLRQLLVTMIGADVTEASDGGEAIAALASGKPDLAILDLGLPGAGGLSLLPRLVQAGVRALVLSMHTETIYARRAMDAGAHGYVTKGIAPPDLIEAVRIVAQGGRYIERTIAESLAMQRVESGGRLHQLGPRDLEIVRLLATGHSMAEIAGFLGISYKTVANTTSLIRAKLGVARTADLVRLATEMRGGLAP